MAHTIINSALENPHTETQSYKLGPLSPLPTDGLNMANNCHDATNSLSYASYCHLVFWAQFEEEERAFYEEEQ